MKENKNIKLSTKIVATLVYLILLTTTTWVLYSLTGFVGKVGFDLDLDFINYLLIMLIIGILALNVLAITILVNSFFDFFRRA